MTEPGESMSDAGPVADGESPPQPADRPIHRLLLVLIILACVGVTALLMLNVIEQRQAASNNKDLQGKSLTPPLFDEPLDMKPFTLTDQDGRAFGVEQLTGKVYVVNFFFSNCAGMCPQILAHTRELQIAMKQRLGNRIDQFEIVSVSVDPEKDTPEKLREIAELWDADLQVWHFLTGTREEVWHAIETSFLHRVTEDPSNKKEPLVHTPRFALVDQNGRIRGFYDGLKPDERSELLRDLLRLLLPDE